MNSRGKKGRKEETPALKNPIFGDNTLKVWNSNKSVKLRWKFKIILIVSNTNLGGSVKPYDYERAGTKTVQFFDPRYVIFTIFYVTSVFSALHAVKAINTVIIVNH